MKPTSEEDRLLKQADLSRARLLAVVDLLDQKREELTHPMRMISKQLPREPIVYLALGLAAFTAISAFSYFGARKKRVAPVRLRSPIERRRPPQSFWGDVANRSAKALTTFAMTRAGKAAINRASGRLSAQALRQDRISALA
jgi:hypothetical protein